LHEVGHSVAHAEKIDVVAGEYLLLSRQLSDRNVEVAADERAEQQCQSCLRADTKPHVSVAERSKLDEQQEQDEKSYQYRKAYWRERQVLHSLCLAREIDN